MKILTNVQTNHLGGIGQTFANFVGYAQKQERGKLKLVGVNLMCDHNSKDAGIFENQEEDGILRLISVNQKCPYFGDVVRTAEGVDDLKNSYEQLVDSYLKVINREKPDLILINGTYFVPWSLFLAGVQTRIPLVLHYHGILSKEVAHYPEPTRMLVEQMEKTFDNDRLLYLFPSNLARKTVENEVFGHKIAKSAILPNPVPGYFFKAKKIKSRKNVGMVARWSAVKNPEFVKKLARYNQQYRAGLNINLVTDTKKARIELKGLGAGVRLVKPMDNKLLASFYGRMGVVVSPSRFETYGNVAQEAIASGTPALISPNMGVAETFRKLGLEEWIVDFKSAGKVAKKAKKMAGRTVDPRVRKLIKCNLGTERISKRMVEILKSV